MENTENLLELQNKMVKELKEVVRKYGYPTIKSVVLLGINGSAEETIITIPY